MSRLSAPAPEDVSADVQAALDKVRAQLGFVPAMFNTLALNPTVLDVVMTLQAKSPRLLDTKTRHTIALAVSQANGCDYCLTMHTNGSRRGGLSDEDIELARAGASSDPARGAAAHFAQCVVESRGKVGDDDLAAIRGAGYTDSQVLAIVTLTVQFLLTNFINNVNQTVVALPDAAPVGEQA